MRKAAVESMSGRQGLLQDIAPMFVYLCSEESAWMTGQAVAIDGEVYN